MRAMLRLTPAFAALRRGKRLAAGVVLAVAVASAVLGAPYIRATAFIIRAAGVQGWPERVVSWQDEPYREESVSVPTRRGSVRGRIYRPVERPRRAIVLTSGVHEAGIDEPRLVGLARALAESGLLVLTPEPVDLMRYRITPEATDTIEDAAVWLLGRRDLGVEDRVGLIGISFSGGLSIVAAGRPSLNTRTPFVLSLGGHGNLPRVLRYLCTGIEPTGRERPPHDYALAVLLYGAAPHMVPPDQAEPLRRALAVFLHGSAMDTADPATARAAYAEARAIESTLPEPAATLLKYANDRNVKDLGPRLLPSIGILGDDPSLSPDRSAPPKAAVLLLHGADDNVIPAVESTLLADSLRPHTEVHVLLSGLISHAELDKPIDVRELGKLIALWKEALE